MWKVKTNDGQWQPKILFLPCTLMYNFFLTKILFIKTGLCMKYYSCSSWIISLRFEVSLLLYHNDANLAKLWMNYELMSKNGLKIVQCFESHCQGYLGACVIFSATD